ncbi:methyltransferase [Pseudonocardiaceae bacterium YIM PH 21723]|nr:methyltransferase [Pseudonocardiaceae bacterium YIM PH 21723]
MSQDPWNEPDLARNYIREMEATVRGHVRVHVLHQHLLEHLPPAPATVLDVGGGAGHQSFPLAEAGYDVTILDPSAPMLERARQRLQQLPTDARNRVTLVEGNGLHAQEAVGGRRFDAVLCHGMLGYLEDPEPLVDQLSRCAAPGGLVSIMTGDAKTLATRPAMEQRWTEALAAFDTTYAEVRELGVRGRSDTVEGLSGLLRDRGMDPVDWYGVWLFVDLLTFGGVTLDLADAEQIAAVELEASRRDPYRGMSRVFHLIARHQPIG